jgi:outer membrane lipoprotein-sorting protein
MMKNFLITLLLAIAGSAAASPSAQSILAASDAVRHPDFSYSLKVALTEYRAGKESDASDLQVYAKADQASGQFLNLVRILAPARDANKLMLKNGNDMWLYDPANKASIRISPQQRLLGQAANGDVMTVNLATDYRASLATEEEIVDGDRQPRHCYKLALEATAPDVTYHRIELWVDTAGNRPLKARYYAESGRLLKTVYFRRYRSELGQQRPTESVIIDGLDPAWVTVLRLSDYVRREVPDAWLQRDYLSRFKPE